MQKEYITDFQIELAGLKIELHTLYNLHKFCHDYLLSEEDETANPDITVRTTAANLEEENERAINYLGHELYSPFMKEKQYVYRQIAEKLPNHNIVLMHAAAIEFDNQAFLFAGPSGSGKSTYADYWKSKFNDRITYINDDKPLIKITDEGVYAFGSPWCGKERRNNNISAPVKGIIFLYQAEENRIRPLKKSECWDLMLNQIYRTSTADTLTKTLGLIEEAMESIPIYSLDFKKSPSAVDLVYSCLIDDKHTT